MYYVSIGNSDNKLNQKDWARFAEVVDHIIDVADVKLYGVWYSLPNSIYQNACWAFEVTSSGGHIRLKGELRNVARMFMQDSIAWAVSETEFITP